MTDDPIATLLAVRPKVRPRGYDLARTTVLMRIARAKSRWIRGLVGSRRCACSSSATALLTAPRLSCSRPAALKAAARPGLGAWRGTAAAAAAGPLPGEDLAGVRFGAVGVARLLL
jgi:hypothetical protein